MVDGIHIKLDSCLSSTLDRVTERAGVHGVSVDEEHRRIIREVCLKIVQSGGLCRACRGREISNPLLPF